MAEKKRRKGPGRPPIDKPKGRLRTFRMDDEMEAAVEGHRKKQKLPDTSAAIRDLVRLGLWNRG
jgi:hypothetical protein